MNTTTAQKSGGQIVAPNVRDLDTLEQTLEKWLAMKMPQATNLSTGNFVYPRGAGMSHETILFDARWSEGGVEKSAGLVIRIKPTHHTVYQDDMFVEQFQIMQTIHRLGTVPIAETLWLEENPEYVGAPFFVMKKLHGRVPVNHPPYATEGWFFDATPAQRRKAWEGAVSNFARLPSIPESELRFLDPKGRFPDGFDQEWERWDRLFAWAKQGREFPFLEDMYARLTATRPTARHPGVVWGDARIGNVMFDDDFNVIAFMDWEQCSLGGALQDLGWWVLLSKFESTANGLPLLDGLGGPEETVQLWGEVSGINTSDFDWYEKFAAFKLSCLSIRMLDLRKNTRPGMDYNDSPPTRALADLYGVARPAPMPEAPVTSGQ